MRAKSKWRDAGSVVAIAFALVAGLVRCSLFVDTDGLTGSDSGALPDASTNDVIAQDASFDAGDSSDGAIATDAGFPGCGASHTLCDDFDTAALGTLWSNQVLMGDASALSLSTAQFVSPPKSLHAVIGSNGGSAALQKNIGVAPSRIHCEVQVMVITGTHQVLFWFFGDGVADHPDYHVSVNLGATNSGVIPITDFTDGGNTFNFAALPNVVNGAWTRLAFDLAPAGGGGASILVTVGNAAPVTVPSPAPAGTQLLNMALGDAFTDNASDMFFDNVLCDVSP